MVFGKISTLAFLALFVSVPSVAVALSGQVVAVHDGDTLTLLHDHQQTKIRLAEIDAPEKAQPFGTRSKQSLADICFQKQAEVAPITTDRYGRTVAHVTCAGQNANAEQVRRGMAWVFDRYTKPDSPLYRLQDEARTAHRGLWADPSPVPPWSWRAKKKTSK